MSYPKNDSVLQKDWSGNENAGVKFTEPFETSLLTSSTRSQPQTPTRALDTVSPVLPTLT